MEKVGHFVDDEQDHTDTQGTDGQDTDNGQASLRTVEDSQHGGDHTDKPGTDGGQNGKNRVNNAGSSTAQHHGIEKHRNTTFQKILLCTVWPQPEHLTKKGVKTRIKRRLESLWRWTQLTPQNISKVPLGTS